MKKKYTQVRLALGMDPKTYRRTAVWPRRIALPSLSGEKSLLRVMAEPCRVFIVMSM